MARSNSKAHLHSMEDGTFGFGQQAFAFHFHSAEESLFIPHYSLMGYEPLVGIRGSCHVLLLASQQLQLCILSLLKLVTHDSLQWL